MNSKIFGCMLLVIGTSIGGGMLALPVVTAMGGFLDSSLLLIFAWAVMLIGALFMAEVNHWFHQDNNIVSMAKQTLGKPGQVVAWITYLGLLYALVSAYIAGGSGVTQSLFQLGHIHITGWLASLLFAVVLAAIVWGGVMQVDRANRLFMSIKFVAFAAIIILVAPHIHWTQSHHMHPKTLLGALTVIITSFGFSSSVPTFCSYLKYDMRGTKIAIIGGSTITLICYLIWDASVQGVISADKLASMSGSNTTHLLTQALSSIANSTWISSFAHLFTSICMFTSFIGVSLGLSDFLADGIKVKKEDNKMLVYGITFIPPLCITLFYPGIFIAALSYAGIFCLILLMLLPALMAWYGRYQRAGIESEIHISGGKPLVVLEILIAITLIAIAIIQKIS